ncbi:MAG: hypothetical protein K8F30_10450 [Taibaiella sp.]|nr:hypothetical protein [Taibaiella sp.]
MKYILPFIILGLSITACKQEKQHCWTCNYTYIGNGKPDKTGDTVLCNFTQTDIDLREGKTFESADTAYILWMIDNCRQQ